MELFKDFFSNFLDLANAMSLYILVGLVVAGVLKETLPSNFISKHLGKSRFSSVIKSTLLGIPMPVCSCSVIPLAKGLQREGASNGAVSSFLISTPITGVDSILATYSLFGAIFTLYRVVTSVIMAVVAGVLQNLLQPKKSFSLAKPKQFSLVKNTPNFSPKGSCSATTPTKSQKRFSIKRVFNYAFNTLFGDIAKSLLFGLVLGAIFSTFLPKELIATSKDNLFITYFLILLVATPLYVCATSSLPIGASLLASGVPIGGVFLFLSAGPATNAVTMSVVKEMFGKRGFFIYISTIMVLSLFFGYILDRVFINFEIRDYFYESVSAGALEYLATTLMFGLMIYHWRR